MSNGHVNYGYLLTEIIYRYMISALELRTFIPSGHNSSVMGMSERYHCCV